jgi:hypothetical protein
MDILFKLAPFHKRWCHQLSETEEAPVEKPKRKMWKIVVPIIIVVAILIPSLMYAYAYIALEDAYSKSYDTIDTSESSLPEWQTIIGTEYSEEITIRNPTSTDIHFIQINFDSWVDGKKFGTVRETDVYLPAGGSTTLTFTWNFDREIVNSALSGSYESRVSHEVVASTDFLFFTVTRTFVYENVETEYIVS